VKISTLTHWRLGLLIMLAPAPALAQGEPPIPDPASLAIPDLTVLGDVAVKDSSKYFVFHKPGVSYAQAYADFKECYRFLPVAGTDPSLPMFAPWRERPGSSQIVPQMNFGLIGLSLGSIGANILDRTAKQSRMRTCLEPRGYARYPIDRATWDALVDGYSERSIALLAKAASGPRPAGERLTR
jgi:hypothetical protein